MSRRKSRIPFLDGESLSSVSEDSGDITTGQGKKKGEKSEPKSQSSSDLQDDEQVSPGVSAPPRKNKLWSSFREKAKMRRKRGKGSKSDDETLSTSQPITPTDANGHTPDFDTLFNAAQKRNDRSLSDPTLTPRLRDRNRSEDGEVDSGIAVGDSSSSPAGRIQQQQYASEEGVSLTNLSTALTNLSTAITNPSTALTNLSTAITNPSTALANLSTAITNPSTALANLSQL
ncbi:uncharacterized protein LOC135473681 [Liolophura sinensis]|uniref:uncharacterized protein LOC135473681 n=1 Tax=Liolophura sinensis TaxID=3198878 RepID=UPI0031580E9F